MVFHGFNHHIMLIRDFSDLHSSRAPNSRMRHIAIARDFIRGIDNHHALAQLVGKYSRDDADGVPQVCFMGVVDPLSPEVETAEQVRDRLVLAAEHIPVARLGATDDCGFSPFSRDLKPAHGSPDFARDIAMQKITARVEGARMASEVLGV